MISRQSEVEQVYILGSISFTEPRNSDPFYNLHLEYLDWNGQEVGFKPTHKMTHEYAGTMPVTALPIFPLKWAVDPEAITERFTQRGKLFEKFRGYLFKYCEGRRIVRQPSPNGQDTEVFKPVS